MTNLSKNQQQLLPIAEKIIPFLSNYMGSNKMGLTNKEIARSLLQNNQSPEGITSERRLAEAVGLGRMILLNKVDDVDPADIPVRKTEIAKDNPFIGKGVKTNEFMLKYNPVTKIKNMVNQIPKDIILSKEEFFETCGMSPNNANWRRWVSEVATENVVIKTESGKMSYFFAHKDTVKDVLESGQFKSFEL